MDYPGAARQARRDGALLGVLFYDRVFYPGFQFGRDNRPLPVISDLLALATQRGRTEADLLAWLMTPSPLLPQIEGRDARPVDVLVTEAEWVVKAVRVRGAVRRPPTRPIPGEAA